MPRPRGLRQVGVTPEMWTLLATLRLALLHITAASMAARRQAGLRRSLGTRDSPLPLTGIA